MRRRCLIEKTPVVFFLNIHTKYMLFYRVKVTRLAALNCLICEDIGNRVSLVTGKGSGTFQGTMEERQLGGVRGVSWGQD